MKIKSQNFHYFCLNLIFGHPNMPINHVICLCQRICIFWPYFKGRFNHFDATQNYKSVQSSAESLKGHAPGIAIRDGMFIACVQILHSYIAPSVSSFFSEHFDMRCAIIGRETEVLRLQKSKIFFRPSSRHIT